MNNHDLFNAMSGIDDGYLLESEEVTTRKPMPLRKLILIAAVVGLLTVTAAGTGLAGFRDLFTAEPELSLTQIQWQFFAMDETELLGKPQESGTADALVIQANLPLDSDAPIELSPVYTLNPPEGWVYQGFGCAKTDGMFSQYTISWEPPGGDGVMSTVYSPSGSYREDYISFAQYSAWLFQQKEDKHLDSLVCIPERVNVTGEIVSLAGIPVLRVNIPAFTLTKEEHLAFSDSIMDTYMTSGETRLYWTDGKSICSFTCPGWMTDEEIEAILSTITMEESAEAFLAAMTTPPEETE